MLIWCALAPVESVASWSSSGKNATLSWMSAPPICISVVPPGVSQRTMGRPEGFAEIAALPGSPRRTKRFISARRAAGVMREKESLLRTVRKRANSVWFWAQAAASALLKALPGALCAEAALDALAELGSGFERESCAKPFAAASSMPPNAPKMRFWHLIWLDNSF